MLATALVAQLAYRVHVAALRLRDGSCSRVWATSHCRGFCPLLFAAFSPEKHGVGSLYVCEKLRFEVSCEIMLFYESAWVLDVVGCLVLYTHIRLDATCEKPLVYECPACLFHCTTWVSCEVVVRALWRLCFILRVAD